MKKDLIQSCIDGIRYDSPGEQYHTILKFFYPEFLAAFVLYALVTLIDARLIAHLKSTDAYATMSITNTLFHFLVKMAEGFSVGTMVLCGYYHGKRDQESVIRSGFSACLMMLIIGSLIAGAMFTGAAHLYRILGTPEELISLGVPVLRLRAVSILFMFLFFSLIGFLRGIKKNGSIIHFFTLGSALFILFDYLLIFGKCGFPQLGLQGSALAAVIQYGVMSLAAIYHLIVHTDIRSHIVQIKALFSWDLARKLCSMSYPIVGDKTILVITKMMLMRHIAHMGTIALSSFSVIRDLESCAFVPALALAQVVTFLVSNEIGAGDLESAKYTIKKAMLLAGLFVIGINIFFIWNIRTIIGFFDTQHAFTDFAAYAFPCLSVLALFDVLQLMLASALRGAAQGRIVLWVRIVSLICFCAPVMYAASLVTFQSNFVKFMTMYGSFYIGSALMTIWYVYWFRSGRWQQMEWHGR